MTPLEAAVEVAAAAYELGGDPRLGRINVSASRMLEDGSPPVWLDSRTVVVTWEVFRLVVDAAHEAEWPAGRGWQEWSTRIQEYLERREDERQTDGGAGGP